MADRYWVGGTGNWNTTNTTNWSTSSGGAGGASVPTNADNVFFNAASGTGTVTVAATSSCLNLDFTGFTGTLAGTSAILIHGNLVIVAGMTISHTGTLYFASTSGSYTVTTNGKTVTSRIIFGFSPSTSTWTLQDALTNTNTNGMTVENGTFDTNNYNVTAVALSSSNTNTRTINLGSSTVTLSGATPINFATSSNLTFNAGTSSIASTAVTATINGGGHTFYDVTRSAGNSSTGLTLNDANTFNNLTIGAITSSGVRAFLLNADQTINGTLTLSAGTNATMRTFVQSSAIGTTRTLTCGAVFRDGVGNPIQDIDFRDITIAGTAAPVSGTRLGDCKGNSGITFDAAKTVYYRATGSASWGATTSSWSLTSGGTADHAAFPLAQDTAVFPSATYPASGSTTTVNAAYNIGTIDMSARTSNTMTLSVSASAVIYGSWTNGTGTIISGTSTLTFLGRSTQTITSAGKTFTTVVAISAVGGSVVLQDALIVNRATASAISLLAGTLDANNYNITLTAGGFSSTVANTRALVLGTSTFTIAGSFTVSSISAFTISGTGVISMTGATTKTFSGGGVQTYPTLNQGGAGTLNILGSNKFADLTNTTIGPIAFTGGTTNEFDAFSINGVSGNLLQLGSTNTTQAILKKPTAWNVGANSINSTNNTGLSFVAGDNDYLSISYINGVLSGGAAGTFTGNFFSFF